MKTGIFKKIGLDDGGKVLVVCDVLCEYYESNGDVGYSNCADVYAVKVAETFHGGDECEIGDPLHVAEGVEVDDLKCGIACCIAYEREDGSCKIACADTDDEGDHLEELLAEYRTDHGNEESDKSADDANIG